MKQRPILCSAPVADALEAERKTMTRRILKATSPEAMALMINMEAGIEVEECKEELIRCNCPYGHVGDILYSRENGRIISTDFEDGTAQIEYSNGTIKECEFQYDESYDWFVKQFEKLVETGILLPGKDDDEPFTRTDKKQPWISSIHMPKFTSRFWLKIVSIKIERLQDITEEDAIVEGVKTDIDPNSPKEKLYYFYPVQDLRDDTYIDSAKTSFYSLWILINGKESWEANPWVWVIEFEQIEKPS